MSVVSVRVFIDQLTPELCWKIFRQTDCDIKMETSLLLLWKCKRFLKKFVRIKKLNIFDIAPVNLFTFAGTIESKDYTKNVIVSSSIYFRKGTADTIRESSCPGLFCFNASFQFEICGFTFIFGYSFILYSKRVYCQ